MAETFVYLLRVDKVEQRDRKVYVRGKGEEAEFTSEDLGWFITCGKLTLGVGLARPDLRVGDILRLSKLEVRNVDR